MKKKIVSLIGKLILHFRVNFLVYLVLFIFSLNILLLVLALSNLDIEKSNVLFMFLRSFLSGFNTLIGVKLIPSFKYNTVYFSIPYLVFSFLFSFMLSLLIQYILIDFNLYSELIIYIPLVGFLIGPLFSWVLPFLSPILLDYFPSFSLSNNLKNLFSRFFKVKPQTSLKGLPLEAGFPVGY